MRRLRAGADPAAAPMLACGALKVGDELAMPFAFRRPRPGEAAQTTSLAGDR